MYISLDYGQKNIGIALSDKNGIIAKSFSIVKNNDKFFDYFINTCMQYNIKGIVVGLPLDIDGNDTKMSLEIKNFVSQLSKDFNIIFWDETLTSKYAEEILRSKGTKRGKVDDISAQIILQEYLDYKNNEEKA